MTIDPTSSLGARLSRAVVSSLDEMARNADIPPLIWEFLRYDEAFVIEGRPRSVDEIENCERWADLLELSEFAFETRSGHRAWYSNDEVWWIEIIALVGRDDRESPVTPERRLVLAEVDSL